MGAGRPGRRVRPRLRAVLHHHRHVRPALFPDDPSADEASQGAQADDRGAAERRRGRHLGRGAGEDHQDRRHLRVDRDRAQHRGAGAKERDPDASAQGHDQVDLDEPLPPLGLRHHWGGARARGSVHAAELLRRGTGSAGVSGPRDDEGGLDRPGARRRGAQEGRDPAHGGLPRSCGREGAARRHGHPAQGERHHRPGAQSRPGEPLLYRRAQSPAEFSPLARRHQRAADVPRPGSAGRRAFPVAAGHARRDRQSGPDRVVVQLPGVQDTAKAKEILGRTATLEVRMVDEDNMNPGTLAAAQAGQVPFGDEFYIERNNQPLLVKKQVVLTGDRLTDAQPGFDNQTQEPAVHLTLDATGAPIFKEYTRENVGKRMAILLIEKGKGEVVTPPVIRSEIGGGRVQISGRMTTVEANDIALLLRAGALAAPMEIVEERTVGPSLGAENIKKGFDSTIYGFAALSLFIVVYYSLFGVFSTLALCANLLFLIALLSMLQATLTLPGIAAIALTLGMAIDANVLINERLREELRGGATPQAAIHAGYERAFGTILDSNVTTLIAGLALLIFGSGPVRGFAEVHCLGILTSIFSSVVVSRSMVNLTYGSRRKLEHVAIGNTAWK